MAFPRQRSQPLLTNRRPRRLFSLQPLPLAEASSPLDHHSASLQLLPGTARSTAGKKASQVSLMALEQIAAHATSDSPIQVLTPSPLSQQYSQTKVRSTTCDQAQTSSRLTAPTCWSGDIGMLSHEISGSPASISHPTANGPNCPPASNFDSPNTNTNASPVTNPSKPRRPANSSPARTSTKFATPCPTRADQDKDCCAVNIDCRDVAQPLPSSLRCLRTPAPTPAASRGQLAFTPLIKACRFKCRSTRHCQIR